MGGGILFDWVCFIPVKKCTFQESIERSIRYKKIQQKFFFQGFITAASNPKAILFFAAFFPQFISFEGNFWIQLLFYP